MGKDWKVNYIFNSALLQLFKSFMSAYLSLGIFFFFTYIIWFETYCTRIWLLLIYILIYLNKNLLIVKSTVFLKTTFCGNKRCDFPILGPLIHAYTDVYLSNDISGIQIFENLLRIILVLLHFSEFSENSFSKISRYLAKKKKKGGGGITISCFAH